MPYIPEHYTERRLHNYSLHLELVRWWPCADWFSKDEKFYSYVEKRMQKVSGRKFKAPVRITR